MKASQVQFNTSALQKAIMEKLIPEQTKRLAAYADNITKEIGKTIGSYNSRHNLDRTGNLLDSLCWGVVYYGNLEAFGFYREQRATELSQLHEWFDEVYATPVGGHYLAQRFIERMSHLHYAGWRVFVAVLAPYWGYWEKGFTFRTRGNANRSRFMRFAVMTQFYDTISTDLRPSVMKFTAEAPTYKTPDLLKKYKKRDTRAGKGGYDVYKKYPKGKGKGKYDW